MADNLISIQRSDKYTYEMICSGGHDCPFCESDDLEQLEAFDNGSSYYLDMLCNVCKKKFRLVYTLSGVENA